MSGRGCDRFCERTRRRVVADQLFLRIAYTCRSVVSPLRLPRQSAAAIWCTIRRFIVPADEKLTAFFELESARGDRAQPELAIPRSDQCLRSRPGKLP